MKDIILAIKNNLDYSSYEKNRFDLKLYKIGKNNNEEPLEENSKEASKIVSLQRFNRVFNLKVYLRNVIQLKLKKFNLIGLPILLSAITFGSWTSEKTLSKSMDTYKKVEITFDEDKIIDYKIDDKLYVDEVFKNYNEENIEGIFSATGLANIRFGHGENTIECYYNIYDNENWQFNGYNDVAYIKVPINDEKTYVDTTEAYDILIEEAAKLLIENNPSVKEKVNEILANQKNDILVEISKYEYIGQQQIEYTTKGWPLRIIILVIDIIYFIILKKYFNNIRYICSLYNENGYLRENNYNEVKIKYAAQQFKKAFLEAEKERINTIYKILEAHADNYDILSKYEKKLVLKEKE